MDYIAVLHRNLTASASAFPIYPAASPGGGRTPDEAKDMALGGMVRKASGDDRPARVGQAVEWTVAYQDGGELQAYVKRHTLHPSD
jgi:hypothetical protein